MRAVDVMVHSSVDPEPFGRTLVEAMLAGVPVVATDAGAAADILDAGAAGTLVPPGDPMPWRRAVARVLGQPDALQGTTAICRPRVPGTTTRSRRWSAAISTGRACVAWCATMSMVAGTRPRGTAGRCLAGHRPSCCCWRSPLVGPSLGSLSRPLFMLGCAAAGWYAWQRSPGAHLQAVLFLFAFSPFVRRLVDLSAGYDPNGIMLAGPLLAIMAPAPRLIELIDGRRTPSRQIAPILVVGTSVAYAIALSMFQGDWLQAASGSLKWIAPLVYAAVLAEGVDRDEMMDAATSAFLVILPIIGLYGILQYVNPPEWDRYWMEMSTIMSAGQPKPFEVRTFSMMNGPASFATFTAAGLLLIGFLRRNWLSLLLTAPAIVAFLLSLYRTAWLSLAAGILFCIFFAVTRRRAAFALAFLFAAVVIVLATTPFASVIDNRLATLMQGSQDGSAQERLGEFVTLWARRDSMLFGAGFTTVDVGVAGSMSVDGMIISAWLTMGIVGGIVCLFGLIWAAVNAIRAAWRDLDAKAVVIGALACGALVQLPLADIASGELGFLFWTFATLALADRPRNRDQPR